MFANRWQLFRLYGIPISVDVSWLVILALITLTIAGSLPTLMHQYYGDAAPTLEPYQYWLTGLIAALAFFICILLHELGHAIVARSRGMPIRGITLFLFGGVAELEGEPPSAGTEFLMAIAGPLVSLALGIGFGLVSMGWLPPRLGADSLVTVLGYLSFVNLLLLAFNLVPAFPLDGGRVLRSFLWGTTGDLRRATHWASVAGQWFAWLLIAWGIGPVFWRQLARRDLVGADRFVPQQCGTGQLSTSVDSRRAARRTSTAVHEHAADRRAAVAGFATLGGGLRLPLSPSSFSCDIQWPLGRDLSPPARFPRCLAASGTAARLVKSCSAI